MKNILLIVLIFASVKLISQTKDQALEFYDAGNAAFKKNNFKAADSLFTLSLQLRPSPDAYYNRAQCKRKFRDMQDYCIDMESAANMDDIQAKRLFWKGCAKMDTILKKANNSAANASDYETAEFIFRYTFNTNLEYEKYDHENNSVLFYEVINKDTIYKRCDEVSEAAYPGGLNLYIYNNRKFHHQ